MAANAARPATIGLLALLLLAGASSATSSPSTAYQNLDGVTYFFAHGPIAAGHAINYGADSGPVTLNAKLCAFGQLRPELGNGRVQVLGLIDEMTYLEMDFEEFLSPDGVTPRISTNLTLDATFGQSPPLDVAIAAWGPMSVRVDYANFTDPVSMDDEMFLQGTFFVSTDGERDDSTQERSSEAEAGDVEMHLKVRTDPRAQPTTTQLTIAPLGDLPDGSFSPNEAYSDRFLFQNTRYGGTATAVVTAQAYAAPGQNEITLAFISPIGTVLAETTLVPALLADGSEQVAFPLDEFGAYFIEVRGKVSMAQYQVSLTLAPPKSLDLDIWWDDVSFGDEAITEFGDCRTALGYAVVSGTIVGRPQPPNWFMEIVIVAIVGGTGGVLLLIKVVTESVASMQLKKRFGR